MKTSQNGIDLIKRFEGCRLTAYKCPAGKPTVGYGHTAGVKMGQRITQAQAEAFLREDLAKFERNVMAYDGKYHWSQNQFDALVSFAFNIGSIDQLTANGERSVQEIAQKFTAYCKAGGRRLYGLVRRREAERDLFLKPAQQGIQAASTSPAQHVQMNYKPGKKYASAVSGLRIWKKRSKESPLGLPNATIVGMAGEGEAFKNLATATRSGCACGRTGRGMSIGYAQTMVRRHI